MKDIWDMLLPNYEGIISEIFIKKKMTKLQIIEYVYNKRQNEYEIWGIDKYKETYFVTERHYYIDIKKQRRKSLPNKMGFYEWLFNPKYKVFEILKIKVHAPMYDNSGKLEGARLKPIKEIIDYIYKEIKSKEK